MRDIEYKDIGRRLLLTDRHTGIPRMEAEILELSPSCENVKIRNIIPDTVFWHPTEDHRVVEVLEEANAKGKRRGFSRPLDPLVMRFLEVTP